MTFRAPVRVPVWIEFSEVTSLAGTRVRVSTCFRVSPRLLSRGDRARSFLSISFSPSLVANGRSFARSLRCHFRRESELSSSFAPHGRTRPTVDTSRQVSLPQLPRIPTISRSSGRGTYEDLISPHPPLPPPCRCVPCLRRRYLGG